MAKKYFMVFILLILLSHTVYAKDVKVSVDKDEITALIGETKSISITIFNNQTSQDTFSVSVFSQYLAGISTNLEKTALTIDPESNQSLMFTFFVSPILCTGEIDQRYDINVKSIKNENVTDSTTVILRVPGTGICISDLRLDKESNVLNPGENVKIKSSVTNTNSKSFLEYSIEVDVKKDDIVIKRFDKATNLLESSKTDIEFDYTPDKYATPGNYSIESILRDNIGRTVDTKTIHFAINPTNYPIKIEKTYTFGVLFTTTTITVKNENNVLIPSFTLTESVPQYTKNFFTPVTKTTSIQQTGNAIRYMWVITDLKPGEERLITYKLQLQNLVVISILVFGAVLFAFNYVFTPKIVKGYRHSKSMTGEKEIVVSIDVKNRSRHEMKDVYVRDLVPTIFNVVEKFGTVKPVVRKGMGGTDLIWKFDILKPFEERILTYTIRPAAEVIGTKRLPNAHIRYLNKKQERKVILSKGVVILPR